MGRYPLHGSPPRLTRRSGKPKSWLRSCFPNGEVKVVKEATRVIRECLTLHCFTREQEEGHVPGGIAEVYKAAFENQDLESELNSQLHLSKSTMKRMGSSCETFDKGIRSIYEVNTPASHRLQLSPLSEPELDVVFSAH